MTDLEQRQQKEIDRLQKKIKTLTKAYSDVVRELDDLKQNHAVQRKTGRGKGRPAVDGAAQAQVLALCRKGYTLREIGEKVQLAPSTVHKIVARASRESRILYVYMDREKPATIIDACPLTEKVQIVNLTDDMLSRAFGVREQPTWEDYLEFLESRCMPRTRYGIREELNSYGINSYDPFQIVEKTKGRVYGDGQRLERMNHRFAEQFDAVMKETKAGEQRLERLMSLLRESKGQVMYNDSEY